MNHDISSSSNHQSEVDLEAILRPVTVATRTLRAMKRAAPFIGTAALAALTTMLLRRR